jgi:hypothetical protein
MDNEKLKHGYVRVWIGGVPVDLPRDKFDLEPCQCEECTKSVFDRGTFFVHEEHGKIGVVLEKKPLFKPRGLVTDEVSIMWEDGLLAKADSLWLFNYVRIIKHELGVSKTAISRR